METIQNWTCGWTDGWVGLKSWVGTVGGGCCPPVLTAAAAAAASGTHFECWMSKRGDVMSD